MNGAYAHLVINHIPVIGTPLVFLLLLSALMRGSKELLQAALVGLILMGAVTIPVVESGESAVHIVKEMPDIDRAQIHEHSKAADFAAVGSYLLAVIAIGSLIVIKRSGGLPKPAIATILVATLFVSAIMARVGHLGGLIRHPEIEMSSRSSLN